MDTKALFKPLEIGKFKINNRIVMAPMTRSRTIIGEVPTDLMALYYAQRASAGLIITEGVPISPEARGYSLTPGIYTKEQIAGWKKVTQAVHAQKGKIFVQLWHVGRRSTKSVAGTTPLAPSAIKVPDKIYGPLGNGKYDMIETDTPKEMTQEDINRTKNDFIIAARNALEAGFDGVEIHGAHGYLFDQFLRRDSNHRTDIYGGIAQNRIRFTIEVIELLIKEIGSDKVGLRISPFLAAGDYYDQEMPDLALLLMKSLAPMKLAYLHFSENIANFRVVADTYREKMRGLYPHPIIVCGNYTKESATRIINQGWADMVAFGRPFISNPDLVERFENNYPLTELTPEGIRNFYGGGKEGYTDYLPYTK